MVYSPPLLPYLLRFHHTARLVLLGWPFAFVGLEAAADCRKSEEVSLSAIPFYCTVRATCCSFEDNAMYCRRACCVLGIRELFNLVVDPYPLDLRAK